MDWLALCELFAQANEAAGDAPRQQGPPELMSFLPPILMAFAVFYFLLIRPQKKEQANRQSMLSTLKKNDKVVTIGGLMAVVTNISDDGDEVTLRIEEGKVRVVRSAIQRIVAADADSKAT